MKYFILAVLIGTAILSREHRAFAQAAAPAAVPVLHRREAELPLSTAEGIAIGTISEKLQQNQKDRDALLGMVRRIEAEIAAAHPGYHFDEASGKIVKDAAPEPAVKPGPAKK